MSQLCRGGDIEAKNRGQHSIELGRVLNAGEEFFDLVQNHFLIANEGQVIVARELNIFRAGNPPSHVASTTDICVQVARPMNEERRNANRRQDACDINLRIHVRESKRGAGTGAAAQIGCPPLFEPLVFCAAWRHDRGVYNSSPILRDQIEKLLTPFGSRSPRIDWRPT